MSWKMLLIFVGKLAVIQAFTGFFSGMGSTVAKKTLNRKPQRKRANSKKRKTKHNPSNHRSKS